MIYQLLFLSKTVLFTVIVLGQLLVGCNQPGGNNAAKAAGIGQVVNVGDYGAKGDGRTDDTKAIQAAINAADAGDTVVIPQGTFLIQTIRLRSNVHLKGIGTLKQLTPKDEEDYTLQRQHSKWPLIRAHRVSDIDLSFRAETMNEAIYVSTSENISIRNSYIVGDSSKLRSFPGILLYQCNNCRVSDTEISNYGKARQSASSYQPGTGIRVLASEYVTLNQNNIHHNGENGIFIHATSGVTIDRNRIHHNGMSAIQIAFGSAALEKDFAITNNRFEYNAADAIDINNRTAHQAIPINGLIASNYSTDNGFVDGQSTPDGSGIATLINVSDVVIRNNRSVKNNRPALYLENCGEIDFNNNYTDGTIEIVHRFTAINLRQNTFANLLLLANANGESLFLDHNTVNRVSLPTGIQIDSLVFTGNQIKSGPVHFNLSGRIRFENNTLHSEDPLGALLVVNASSTTIRNNRINSTGGAAITTRKSAGHVQIDSNVVESRNACVFDDGSPRMKVTNNTFVALPGGEQQRTFMSRNPDGLLLENNEHRAGKQDNSIRLIGQGTARIVRERIVTGYPDYGSVEVTEE
ncbi:right-handed parallel beta-helix repeat-containing protein [Parapedobacter lycopersici]|uniref:right-handed parallel beta-helix repeat-containing protein n=1 Tax=Parapedobacter lycopersici TaxID=1864939 RepID=UPI003341574B